MQTVGLFADIGNLYHCVNRKFEGRKLDYQQYTDRLISDEDVLLKATAYGIQVRGEATKFITCLRHYGFETRFKKPKTNRNASWTVGMVLDIIEALPKLKVVVIGSSDPQFVDLVEFIKSKNTKCIIAACGIPKELKEVADSCIEITEEYLEDTQTTK